MNDWGKDYLAHHGIKGMKWGVRRYQNEDGSLTTAGKRKYQNDHGFVSREKHITGTAKNQPKAVRPTDTPKKKTKGEIGYGLGLQSLKLEKRREDLTDYFNNVLPNRKNEYRRKYANAKEKLNNASEIPGQNFYKSSVVPGSFRTERDLYTAEMEYYKKEMKKVDDELKKTYGEVWMTALYEMNIKFINDALDNADPEVVAAGEKAAEELLNELEKQEKNRDKAPMPFTPKRKIPKPGPTKKTTPTKPRRETK